MECVPRSIAERVELQCNGCCSCVITGVCVSGHELISNAEPVEDISEFAVFVRVMLADFNANQLVAGQAYFHDCAVEPVGDHPARLTVKLEDIFQSVDGLAKLQAVFTGLTAQQIDGLESSLLQLPCDALCQRTFPNRDQGISSWEW